MPKKAPPRKKARVARTTPSVAPRSPAAQTPTRRPRHPMPAFVQRALQERELLASYRQRPAYQRNDYLGWIGQAKREGTRQKRLGQMLAELAAGDRYMNMAWRPRSLG